MTLYALADRSPDVADDAWVAPGSHVIGDIVLEAKTSIWFGATLRGDNEQITIGAGSNVQENSVLHTDMGYDRRLSDCGDIMIAKKMWTQDRGDRIIGCKHLVVRPDQHHRHRQSSQNFGHFFRLHQSNPANMNRRSSLGQNNPY